MIKNLLQIAYNKLKNWSRQTTRRISSVKRNNWVVVFPKPTYIQRMRGFFRPNEIIPNLYIGSCIPAMDKKFISTISLVINVTKEIPNYFDEKNSTSLYLRVPLEDINTVDIPEVREKVETTVRFLRNGKKVYIHCFAGRSRSALFTLLVMMKLDNSLSLTECYMELISKRPCVALNTTFYKYLLLQQQKKQ